ncbi:MAG: class I SAM-dependent methyltransferase [Anaerolineales bacterium]
MPLIDHFDILAPLYDRVINRPEDLPLREYLNLKDEDRLLDAGGGTGRIAEILASTTSSLVLLDTSYPMLKQSLGKDCCSPVAGATEHPPFTANAFDRIMMVDAFHHLADQPLSLRQLWRLLRPGGRFVIEEPDINHWGVRLVALAEKLLLMRSHFQSGQEIGELLRSFGGEVRIEKENYTVWIIADKPIMEEA